MAYGPVSHGEVKFVARLIIVRRLDYAATLLTSVTLVEGLVRNDERFMWESVRKFNMSVGIFAEFMYKIGICIDGIILNALSHLSDMFVVPTLYKYIRAMLVDTCTLMPVVFLFNM